jgi:CheY-like chemotaxis protein
MPTSHAEILAFSRILQYPPRKKETLSMAPDTTGSTPEPFSRKSRYILVIEGNTQELFTTAMLLHRFSYPVCTARNARQALDMVSVAMPALIVTDDVLPDMSGIDFMRVLGSNTHTFSIPVILILPPGGAGHGRGDIEIGGHLCLQKPVQLEDLFRAVQEAMEPTPRANIRIQTALPVTVNKVVFDGARGECVSNISSQGMYIRTIKHHRQNKKLSLQVTIDSRIINVEATVLYSRRRDSGPLPEPGMAVKFTRIADEDRDFIRQFIRDQVTRGIVTILPTPDPTPARE